MKNKFWVFILVLVIIAPSLVAVGSYIYTKGSPVTQNSVSSITITDLYNHEESFERNSSRLDLSNIGGNMVQFFTDINTSAKAEPQLPEPLQGTKYYKVVINNYGREVEYKYYFSNQPDYCYYLDDNGKCFSINREYAVAFLTSVYGRSVFKNATLPVMTTPAGEKIAPAEIKWTYLTVDNLAATYSEKNKDTADTVYNIAEKIDFDFSIDEGLLNIQVSDSTGEIYNGLYENIDTASIPTGAELDVTVNAKWYQTEDRASEGEATYSFKCRVTDKPVFALDINDTEDKKVEPGDFVNISGKNVICDPENIVVTVTPDIKTQPVFYKDGYYVRALLPVPLGTKAGNYSVKITADGTEHTFDFKVAEKTYTNKNEQISSTLLSDESIADFDEAMKDIFSAKSSERYFEGAFVHPVKNSVISSGYGRPTKNENGYEYINNWVRMATATGVDIAGSEVIAMNAGKVVYVGEQTLTGQTVVVDHGLGLMSVYANMSSVSVNEGDVLATADVIGTAGTTGYTSSKMMSVALVINGTYVSPYDVWYNDKGVIFSE
ncbi:MAG: M23 family metallopeptidase [Clostridia bacterium]|nr:M23 family metallopeptidase [Clostridia bacterium]